MGQDRLNNLAITSIERAALNRVLQLQMNEIIDTFGQRKNIDSLLFYRETCISSATAITGPTVC